MIPTLTITKKDADTLAAIREDVDRAEAALGAVIGSRRRAVAAAAKHGATMREIAEAVGVSFQRVGQILKEN